MSQPLVAVSEMRWDMDAARAQHCDIVSTVGDTHAITLNFGKTTSVGEALTAGLRRRIVMPPLSAKHLRDALQNLLAAVDAKKAPGR